MSNALRISVVEAMKDQVTARIRREPEYCRGWCRESSLEEVVRRKSGSFIVEVDAVRLGSRAEGQTRNMSRNRTLSTRRLWEHGMNQGLGTSDAVDEEIMAAGMNRTVVQNQTRGRIWSQR
jgi:hypothetical protein